MPSSLGGLVLQLGVGHLRPVPHRRPVPEPGDQHVHVRARDRLPAHLRRLLVPRGEIRHVRHRVTRPRHRRLRRRHERPPRREPPQLRRVRQEHPPRRRTITGHDAQHPSTRPTETGRHSLAAASIHAAPGASRAAPPSLTRCPPGTPDPPTTTRTPTTTRQRLEEERSAHGLCTDAAGRYAAEPQVKAGLTVDCKSGAVAPRCVRPQPAFSGFRLLCTVGRVGGRRQPSAPGGPDQGRDGAGVPQTSCRAS